MPPGLLIVSVPAYYSLAWLNA